MVETIDRDLSPGSFKDYCEIHDLDIHTSEAIAQYSGQLALYYHDVNNASTNNQADGGSGE